MDDPGYSSYQDSRLIPPYIAVPIEEETPVGSYRSCSHQYACLRLFKRTVDFELLDPDDEEIADRLECEWCDEWMA